MLAISTSAGALVKSDIAWIALSMGGEEEITSLSGGEFVDDTDDSDAELAIPHWFEFEKLRNKWHEERGIVSSLTKIVTCPSYLRIIGMGEKAVPLILLQLREEGDDPDFWFWALEAITGENPVAEADVGNMRAMAEAWLDWGLYR